MVEVNSPNTVLANSLDRSLDIIGARIKINKPKEVVFSVGTQINGVPHIGTYLVLCASFVMAKIVNEQYGIPTHVEFGGLDNAPYDIVKSKEGTSYQRTYYHALSKKVLDDLMVDYYDPYFAKLKEATGVSYTSNMYTDTQASEKFRKMFIRTLEHSDKLGWCLSPSSGKMRIRIPCPVCYYAEKHAKTTQLVALTSESATFNCVCLNHGEQQVVIDASAKVGPYLDINTLYRNLIKEAIAAEDHDSLYVMVKGGDWAVS